MKIIKIVRGVLLAPIVIVWVVLRTVVVIVTHPINSIKNLPIIFGVFAQILVFGFRIIREVKPHMPPDGVSFPPGSEILRRERRGRIVEYWSAAKRGVYVWDKARHLLAIPSLTLSGLRVSHSGLEQIDESRSCIVVANHASNLDIVLLVGLFAKGRFVAKREIFWAPIIGTLAWLAAQIRVTRKNREADIQSIETGLEEWPDCKLIFFPEGTRTKNGQLGKFRRGAFYLAKKLRLPIAVVAIQGTFEALPKGPLLKLNTRVPVSVRLVRLISAEESRACGEEELAAMAKGAIEEALRQSAK